MKKIALMLALMIATMTVAAENILYFTYSQAARTVATLNNQNELMIYCGYEDELPTYVLVNEIWAEQISSSFYEIWLYGYDAYTGEEIFMPIDLECIYLMQNRNIYSAAQYLRFRYSHARPTFSWAMPPYNPYMRAPRPTVYYYTYHYDIHRPGWHYRDYPYMHYHPYYRRLPSYPAPMPPKPYTPGRERPGYHEDPHGGYHYTNEPLVGNITTCRSKVPVHNDPTQRSGSRITSNRSEGTITTTDRTTGSRTTSAAPSRTGEVNSRSGNTNSRGSSSTSSSTSGSRSTGVSGRSGDNGNSRGNERVSGSNERSSSSTTGRSSGTETKPTSSRSTGSEATSSSSRSGNKEGTSSSSRSSNDRNGSSTSSSSRSGNSEATSSSSRSGRSTGSEASSSSSRSGNNENASSSSRGSNSRSGSSRSGNSNDNNSSSSSRGSSSRTR